MRVHKYPAFAVARLVVTVSSTLLKMPDVAVTVEGRLQRPRGKFHQLRPDRFMQKAAS
jgi:hypothetical protein